MLNAEDRHYELALQIFRFVGQVLAKVYCLPFLLEKQKQINNEHVSRPFLLILPHLNFILFQLRGRRFLV